MLEPVRYLHRLQLVAHVIELLQRDLALPKLRAQPVPVLADLYAKSLPTDWHAFDVPSLESRHSKAEAFNKSRRFSHLNERRRAANCIEKRRASDNHPRSGQHHCARDRN